MKVTLFCLLIIAFQALGQEGFYYSKSTGNYIYFKNSDTLMYLSEHAAEVVVASYKREDNLIQVKFNDYNYYISKRPCDSVGLHIVAKTDAIYNINQKTFTVMKGDRIFVELDWGVDSVLTCTVPQCSIILPAVPGCYKMAIELDPSLFMQIDRDKLALIRVKKESVLIVNGIKFKKK